MLPPVSEPSAQTASPAATAAAAPPDEPPGTRVRSCGFLTAPKYDVSLVEPIANSSMLTLPTMGMPAALSFSTTVASNGGTKSASILDAQVVLTPFVQMLSLTAIGTPLRGPSAAASNADACDIASSLDKPM